MNIHNPYWDMVRNDVKQSQLPWGGQEVDWMEGPDRDWLTSRYSWTITDPDSVAFVAEHAHNGVVDPMAGTAYWAYQLAQQGIGSVCYDIDPAGSKGNVWHKDGSCFLPVERRDGVEAVTKHPDRTLLLSWPPYAIPIGFLVLDNYAGNRVITMGEGWGGCTGDDHLYQRLSDEWKEVELHVPVRWFGIRDYITVYER